MTEHTRVAVAAPVPICIFLLVFDLIGYLRRKSLIERRYPDTSNGRRLDLYLSRNVSINNFQRRIDEEVEGDSSDKHLGLAISACMERARSQFLATEREGQNPAASTVKCDQILEEIKSQVSLRLLHLRLIRLIRHCPPFPLVLTLFGFGHTCFLLAPSPLILPPSPSLLSPPSFTKQATLQVAQIERSSRARALPSGAPGKKYEESRILIVTGLY